MRSVLARVVAMLRRDAVADDIREELEFHVRERAIEYERAGLAAVAARRRARERFGDLDTHLHRGYAVRGSGVMETIWHDVKYAVRSLRRQPGFAALAIATLALGIGASTAIFSVIDAATLRPLPYAHPEQLVTVLIEGTRPGAERRTRLAPSIEDVRALAGATQAIHAVAIARQEFPLVVQGPDPERLSPISISEGYLDVFGVAPVLGRNITPDDARPGAPQVVLLGHRYWLTRFNGDPGVLGRTMSFSDGPATIVGVVPASFQPATPIWRAFQEPSRRGSGADVYARLRAGVPLALAEDALSVPLPPDPRHENARASLSSMLDAASSAHATTSRVLGWSVALVLVIGCVNVAGLLLVRGAARERELAVRASIGAGRGRLVRQLLTESLVLALAGGAIGLGLMWLAIDGIAWAVPISFEPGAAPGVHGATVTFALVLSIVTSLSFGLWPALALSRGSVQRVLQRAASGAPPRAGRWLIAVEVAVALVLLTGAGLMLRTIDRLSRVDLGFDPEPLLAIDAVPVPLSVSSVAQYYPALVEAVSRLPGVEAAGATDALPLGGGMMTVSFARPSGAPMPDGPIAADMAIRGVTAGYLRALGVALLGGRDISADDVAFRRRVAVIGEGLAREWFPETGAVGRTIDMGRETREIIGVVSDLRQSGPASDPMMAIYLPFVPSDDHVMAGSGLSVVVRQRPGASVSTADLRAAATSLGVPVLIDRISTGPELFSDRIVNPRRRTWLLSLFAGFGLLLTLVGIFGVTAFAVARRTREIGVRMAFGARAGQVVGTMLRDAVWPVAIGLVVGLAGAAFATKVIASFLFETTPTDVPTFAAVAIALAVTAMIAAWIPARRAARVDPVSALRSE